jgi:adenylate kinase family enzyme
MAKEDPGTALSLKAGKFAPEEQMRMRIRNKIGAATSEHGGYVLEGFPRTIAQYVALRMWGHTPVFIHLDIDATASIERLIARAREDDVPDAIAQRIETYSEQTKPLLELIQDQCFTVPAFEAKEDLLAYTKEQIGFRE